MNIPELILVRSGEALNELSATDVGIAKRSLTKYVELGSVNLQIDGCVAMEDGRVDLMYVDES